MAEEYFNEYFHPELANVAVKGQYLEAVADMLDASADYLERIHINYLGQLHKAGVGQDKVDQINPNYHRVEIQKKTAQVLRSDKAIQFGISIEEIPALITQFSVNNSMDTGELVQKLQTKQTVISNEYDYYNITEKNATNLIQELMSYAVCAQSKNPEALTELTNLKMHNGQQLSDSRNQFEQKIEMAIKHERPEDVNQEVDQLRIEVAIKILCLENYMSKLASAVDHANPVREVVNFVLEDIKLNADKHLSYILGMNIDTHTGKIDMANLRKEATKEAIATGMIESRRLD